MAVGKKVWWIGLKILIKKLCKYYMAHKDQLPDDLPAAVTAMLVLVEAACAAIIVYDKERKKGRKK